VSTHRHLKRLAALGVFDAETGGNLLLSAVMRVTLMSIGNAPLKLTR
jgi:hypothetical protein